MADVVITISISSVQYTSWLRTSYIASSQISESGMSMVKQFELGPDQSDAFSNYMDEASKEVAKMFSYRQGDVLGVPFEYTSTNVIYRFNELDPVLKQASVLKTQLNEDVKNALFSFVSKLWFTAKDKQDLAAYFQAKFDNHCNAIERNLYLLHD